MAQLPCIGLSWPPNLGVAIAIYFHHSVFQKFQGCTTPIVFLSGGPLPGTQTAAARKGCQDT